LVRRSWREGGGTASCDTGSETTAIATLCRWYGHSSNIYPAFSLMLLDNHHIVMHARHTLKRRWHLAGCEMDKRLLLIDDDEALAEMLHTALEAAGYQVETAGNGIEGIHKVVEHEPDLIILDVIMPQMDGWETCRRIREISSVPILILTGSSVDPAHELIGLQNGADLYMIKPFDIPILVARVNALIRRAQGTLAHSGNNMITVGDLQIDLAAQAAARRGQRLELTRTEYRLLVTLAACPGRVIPNSELIHRVWGDNDVGDQEQYLKLYIYYLRQKIEDDPTQPRYIRNRRGIGYLLTCPEILVS
jgi:two-component system, OmpR family, KDP operon response regulator KdpE